MSDGTALSDGANKAEGDTMTDDWKTSGSW